MLLLYNERERAPPEMDRDNYCRRSEPTRLGKVFPDFATILPLSLP